MEKDTQPLYHAVEITNNAEKAYIMEWLEAQGTDSDKLESLFKFPMLVYTVDGAWTTGYEKVETTVSFREFINSLECKKVSLTEEELQQHILDGEKVYCLLSIDTCNYATVNTASFSSGGYVDGWLSADQSPFNFPVYYTEPRTPNSWYGRAYYRTAIPVNKETRERL